MRAVVRAAHHRVMMTAAILPSQVVTVLVGQVTAVMRTSACPIATTKGRATATAMGAPVIRDDHRVPASTATVVLDSTNTGDEQTDALSRIISVSPFPAPAPHSSPFELCVHTLETTPAHHFYPSCISPIQRST